MTGASKNTVERLLVSVGEPCVIAYDKLIHHINLSTLQLDEIWSFVGCKDSTLTRKDRKKGRGESHGGSGECCESCSA